MITNESPLAERALTYFRLVDDGDLLATFDLFHSDAVYRRPGQHPLEGKEALVAFYEGPRGIDRTRHDVKVIAVDGDCVVVEGRANVWWESGKESSFRFVDLFWFRGDRIAQRHGYVDAALP